MLAISGIQPSCRQDMEFYPVLSRAWQGPKNWTPTAACPRCKHCGEPRHSYMESGIAGDGLTTIAVPQVVSYVPYHNTCPLKTCVLFKWMIKYSVNTETSLESWEELLLKAKIKCHYSMHPWPRKIPNGFGNLFFKSIMSQETAWCSEESTTWSL